jgi:heme-degrading monooxygenase HmoA
MRRMIARLWRGSAASAANADAYQRHVRGKVLPELRKIAGHRGAQILRRDQEFLVITLWESMDAIRRFAGSDPERAVVEPEAKAVLAEYDDVVRHYEVQE